MMRHPLRLWQRLSTRMVAAFVLVTLFAIGLAAFVMMYGLADVPLLGRLEAVRDVQGFSRLLEEVVSAKLLNLTRVGVLLIDPMAQAEAQRTPDPDSEAQQRVRSSPGVDPEGGRTDDTRIHSDGLRPGHAAGTGGGGE